MQRNQAIITSSARGQGVLHEPGFVIADARAEAQRVRAELLYLQDDLAHTRASLDAARARNEELFDQIILFQEEENRRRERQLYEESEFF